MAVSLSMGVQLTYEATIADVRALHTVILTPSSFHCNYSWHGGSEGTIMSKYANLPCRGKTRHNSLIRHPALPGVVARISPGSISFFFSGKSNDRDNPRTQSTGACLLWRLPPFSSILCPGAPFLRRDYLGKFSNVAAF